MSRIRILAVALLLSPIVVPAPAAAQESPSYKLTESTFNAGGNPAGGATPTSAGFRVSMDAVGDPAVVAGSSSASYRMDASFAVAYGPPGEVRALRFSDRQTLEWDPEKSLGRYNLYRESIGALSGGDYGNCEQRDLTEETAIDGADPPPSDGYFYLVTARNRLDEEGTMGVDGDGFERPNTSPCP